MSQADISNEAIQDDCIENTNQEVSNEQTFSEENTNSQEKTVNFCKYSLPKVSEKDKRKYVKNAMIATLGVTALSGLLPMKYGRKIHTLAGLSFIGLCALHTMQNKPKKK